MSIGLTTGIKALFAAQLSMETTGHNIANAEVEGYSRQSVLLRTDTSQFVTGLGFVGTGVRVDGITRAVDELLDRRIREQNRSLGRLDRERAVLSQMEDILNEPGEGGLGEMLSGFFESLNDLSLDPADPTLRSNVVSSAQLLADGFNHLTGQLEGLRHDIGMEIETKTEAVNQLGKKIFELNHMIRSAAATGAAPNDLLDQRTQALKELNRLVDARVMNQSDGGVTVLVDGRILVSDSTAVEIEAVKDGEGGVTLHFKGDGNALDLRDGELKALTELQSKTLPALSGKLDTLAAEMIFNFNRLHATGLPKDGAFQSLTAHFAVKDLNQDGDPGNEILAEAGLPFVPEAGTLLVNVTNEATGEVKQTEIQVDPTLDGLNNVAARLDAVDHLNASIDTQGHLTLHAAQGYRFDFAPRLDPNPDDAGVFGTVPVALTGRYTGTENKTWTFEASGTGTVGVTPDLTVTVRDGAGDTVAVLDVGEGYAPGDWIEVADGVKVSFGAGAIDAAAGDAFTAKMTADSDTGGLLAALGINVFFSGSTASDMGVVEEVAEDPFRFAAGLSANPGDNGNLLRMVGLQDQPLEGLGAYSMKDYYATAVGKLGLDSAWASDMYQTQELLVKQLENQRSSVSGVSLDEELLNMQRYQQMLQAAARYIQYVSDATEVVMQM